MQFSHSVIIGLLHIQPQSLGAGIHLHSTNTMHNKYEEIPLVLTKRPHATPTQNSMITQKVKSFDPKQIMIRLVFYLPSTSGRREPTTRLEFVGNIMS